VKKLVLAAFFTLASPAFGEKLTGVLVNPYTGYVSALIMNEGAKVQPSDLAACGPGCEFTEFILAGQCMTVSISRREAAYGYNFGPADDLANSRAQAHHYCKRYGGKNCKEYQPICG
jgi:hypothetical protein